MPRPTPQRCFTATLVILGVPLALLAHRGAGLIDFRVDPLGEETLPHGCDLYQARTVHGFLITYPPFAAIIFLPVAWMSFQVGYVMWSTLKPAPWCRRQGASAGSGRRRMLA